MAVVDKLGTVPFIEDHFDASGNLLCPFKSLRGRPIEEMLKHPKKCVWFLQQFVYHKSAPESYDYIHRNFNTPTKPDKKAKATRLILVAHTTRPEIEIRRIMRTGGISIMTITNVDALI